MTTTLSPPTASPSGLKLQTVGVSKSFVRADEELLVLEDINLSFRTGEFVSLVGASGCGKTTLLRIIDGLIEPTDGEVLLDGQRIGRPGPDRGFVFQTDCLLPWRSVLDNIVFGMELQRIPKSQARRRAQELINLVGLAGFEGHFPLELSGGMRQRVNLARALAVDPQLLLMDEPFAALDAQTREIMQSELLKMWRQTQKTVIFVTHQIEEAIYLSDRVIVFSARPAKIREIVSVNLGRPRALAVKRSQEFLELADRVWTLIEDEVLKSMGREQEERFS